MTEIYLEKLSAFGRMLRAEGLNVGPKDTEDGARLLAAMDLQDREQVKTALRTVYASSREEQLTFDRVFDGFFLSEEAMRAQAKEQMEREQELEQHRLRLVLPVVGGGDEVGMDGRRGAAEEVVAGAAARLLHGEVPSGGEGVDLHPLGVEGDIAGIAESADKLLVALRRGAHTVVQVRRRHAEVPLLSQTPETVQ